jgi:hypothetical protein
VGSVGREVEQRRICPRSGGYNSLVEHDFLFLIKITQILANKSGGRGGFRDTLWKACAGAHLQVLTSAKIASVFFVL